MNQASPAAELHALALRISEKCTECGACMHRCAFLRECGTPKAIADRLLTTGKGRVQAFECSLCGLCATVCPSRLPITDFFLAMRRAAMDTGRVSLVPYRPLLTYERLGSSRLLSTFRLPPGGDTVFFPGCTFPGAHPGTARRLLKHLREHVPNLGLVMACCHKPSHDLGRQEFFERQFGALHEKMRAMGVTRVLTACPNCFKVFSEYGDGIAVQTVYDVLSKHPVTGNAPVSGPAIVHTPCPYRGQAELRDTLRGMTAATGLDVQKTRQDGALSPCCGEGGAVGMLRPELSAKWGAATGKRAEGRTVVTSCAGCVNFLSGHARSVHLLDLIFQPQATMSGALSRRRGLVTYLHRLIFKFFHAK